MEPQAASQRPSSSNVWAPAASALGTGLAIAIVFSTATIDSLWRGAAESKGSTTTNRIGDCVNSTAMAAPLISKADCGVDPSYTVGAIVRTDTGCRP
jgi:hypothetical protein